MVKKKGGGKKQVLHLSQFLGDASPVATNVPAPVWNEDASTDLSLPPPDYVPNPPSFDVSCLPTAPRAQREGNFDPSKIPRQPPYTAYVGNLPFDSENDDVINMFRKDTVKDVRLLTDKETGRFKGFGYVEFFTPEALLEALKLNEKQVRGRPIKVDVATKAGENNKEGSNADRWERGRTNERTREPYEDKTSDDWRSEAKAVENTEAPIYNRRGGLGGTGGERRRYDNNNSGGGFDNFSRSDFGTKINDPPKEVAARYDRGENAWRSRDSSGRSERSERPRLNLKPRENSKPSPFGDAKPVDTRDRGDKSNENRAKSKVNPFGNAKPTDTANWRSSRVQGTGPIKTPVSQISPRAIIKDKPTEDITDSNKFGILKDEDEE